MTTQPQQGQGILTVTGHMITYHCTHVPGVWWTLLLAAVVWAPKMNAARAWLAGAEGEVAGPSRGVPPGADWHPVRPLVLPPGGAQEGP